MSTAPDPARALVDHLMAHPEILPFPARAPRLCETHISWVLLFGDDVLKIKKPVSFGFVDYSTLARRDHFAHEELRLNRRLVPELYLDVLRITGTPDAPRFDGAGPLLEVAVHMRQFDPEHQLDEEIEAGRLTRADVREVADAIAAFQADAPRTEPADDWGRFEAVMAPIRENFTKVREAAADVPGLAERLEPVEAESEALGRALASTIEARRAGGFVREGHGDLHLGNLARTPWGLRAFDALEFNPSLRWLDVMSDLAFLFMDLEVRRRRDLAWTLIDAWSARTGDHDGLRLLRFYALYRTMVRAKVAALRREQRSDDAGRADGDADLERYLAHAETLIAPPAPRLVVMSGPSGSGKSRLAEALCWALPAVRLRSDVERKRLLGFEAEDRTADPERVYSKATSARVSARLERLADGLLAGGLSVIVDATHLHRAPRQALVALARRRGVAVTVVACDADAEVLAERVRRRAAAGSDPSEADVAVLEAQLAQREPVDDDEGFDAVLRIDTTTEGADEASRDALAERIAAAAATST
jgi:aminoglycoside phosphotransferase family enzyme/predicted kinase